MEIVFYCGVSNERWSPQSRVSGIGGSQEALIELGEALAARGCRVRVFNDCGLMEGEYNRVLYQPYTAFPSDGECDLLVLWRWPRLRGTVPSAFRWKHCWLWIHDNVLEGDLRGTLTGFERVVFGSAFHRNRYPFVPDGQALVIRNGIRCNHFALPIERDPFKVVYGSDYHRGLSALLNAWPRVRQAVPKASLTVFYGWQNLMRQAFRPALGWRQGLHNNPLTFAAFWTKTTLRMRAAGVRHLGRIGHPEVAREFLSAGVWAYPTFYAESSCITAMKAQAGGAWPVIIPTGALQETVQYGARTNAVAQEPATLRQWESLLIEALRDPPREAREEMREWATNHFSWDAVASEWLERLQQ